MDIVGFLKQYSEEEIKSVVEKITELLDHKINSSDSGKVRELISSLSAYRGLLLSIEAQLYRDLVDKSEEAIEKGIMNGKSKEIREMQLDSFIKVEKGNHDFIKKCRDELNNKITQASSVLKSIDNGR